MMMMMMMNVLKHTLQTSRIVSNVLPMHHTCFATIHTAHSFSSSISSKQSSSKYDLHGNIKVPLALIRELRALTSAPILTCRKALRDSDLNIADAQKLLRERGIKAASYTSLRKAADGVLAMQVNSKNSTGVIVQINTETDFVARNTFIKKMALQILDFAVEERLETSGNMSEDEIETFTKSHIFDDDGRTIKQAIYESIATMGESIVLRSITSLHMPPTQGVVSSYLHNKYCEGVGTLACLVSVRCRSKQKEFLAQFAKKVAMHVALMNPSVMRRKDLSPALVESEESMLTKQAENEGKTGKVLKQIVAGRMKKFYKEHCLEDQNYGLAPDRLTIKQLTRECEQQVGCKVELGEFIRLRVGELAKSPNEEEDDEEEEEE